MVYKLGTIVRIVSFLAFIYACVIFFAHLDLPPNTRDSRLPSTYMLLAGATGWLAGSVLCMLGRRGKPKRSNPEVHPLDGPDLPTAKGDQAKISHGEITINGNRAKPIPAEQA